MSVNQRFFFRSGVMNPSPQPDDPQPNDWHPSEQGEADEHKAKIHADEVKDRHTSHWDLDYMSSEEMDAAFRQGRASESAAEPEAGDEEAS
jgi:hypothetical protein